jgi:hypothetical protein
MKRNLVILFFMLTGIIAWSQNTGNESGDFKELPDNIHLGVKVGLNISNLVSAELIKPRLKPSMVVGLSASYLKAKKYLWQFEINGSFRGARFSYDSAGALDRLSFFYLDVPLMFHLAVDREKKIWPFIGVQPSLIIRKDAFINNDPVSQPIGINIKNYDLGLVAGAFYRVNDILGFQLMFYYGFLNINRSLSLPFYPYLGSGKPLYNRSLQISLVF